MAFGLFPPIDPFAVTEVETHDNQVLYLEQSGNPTGIPVLFLHGGPGFPWSPRVRCFVDPDQCRFIAFDQRGSGRSRPLGMSNANTTDKLVADIETIRKKLEIDKWIVFGGSWGSCLSLCYAVEHPDRCIGLVLWGIFLGDLADNDWLYECSRFILPAAWQKLAEPIAEERRTNLLRTYQMLVDDPDPAVHRPALQRWLEHNRATANLRSVDPSLDLAVDDASLRNAVQICIAYCLNAAFKPEGYLRGNLGTIGHIPGTIVHGSSDFLCPLSNAFDLAILWPNSELVVVPDAGHSEFEPKITHHLMRGIARLVELSEP